jgi:type I restriction enzyme S subunit
MSETVEQSEIREGYKSVYIGPREFSVPDKWETKRIPEMCDLSTKSFDANKHNGETFEYIDIESVSRGKIDQSKTIPVTEAPSRAKQIVRAGNTLVGKVRPYLQAFAPVTEQYDGFVCSTGFAVLDAKEGISPKFLTQAVLSKYFLDQMTNRMTGTSYPAVNKSDFESVRLLVPPLPEQRRIANILSTVDEQIQQTDEVIKTTNVLKRGLMQSLFSCSDSENAREVRFGSNLATIPADWEVTTLSQVCKKIVDGPHTTPDYADTGIPFVSAGDIENGEIDFENCKKISEEDDKELRKRVDSCKGDILLGKVGSGSLGKVCIVDTSQRFNIFVQLALLRPRTEDILPGYLGTALQYRQMQQQILDNASGASMQYIGTGAIGELEIPLPTVDEQKEISKGFKRIRQKLRQERKHKSKLQGLKRGLMQDLLTGKVRVTAD